jgi:hypothetical protein
VSSRTYSRADYDEAMHHFQTCQRSSFYPHNVEGDGIGLILTI